MLLQVYIMEEMSRQRQQALESKIREAWKYDRSYLNRCVLDWLHSMFF